MGRIVERQASDGLMNPPPSFFIHYLPIIFSHSLTSSMKTRTKMLAATTPTSRAEEF
jgi:hypothetical protein